MKSSVEKALKLIKDGGPIAGAAVGGAIGVIAGGPATGALGGALGATMGKVVEDAAGRALSRRERVRVGATAWYAFDFTRERLDAGERVREDGFFENLQFGASVAEEIFDGVLQKSKSDHEERKARHYGKFFSNLAFDTTCSRDESNYFLHLLERLTYSQLIIIALFGAPADFPLPDEAYENKRVDPVLSQTLLATFELTQLGLLKHWQNGGDKAQAVLDMGDITARHVGLSISGKRLFDLAGLSLVPVKERTELAEVFSSSDRAGGILLTEISKLRGR
jgi:hypothetical protein